MSSTPTSDRGPRDVDERTRHRDGRRRRWVAPVTILVVLGIVGGSAYAVWTKLQSELFSVGAELATPDPQKHGTALVGDRQIAALEAAIDQLEETLPPLKNFILPGGSTGAALLHVARGISRRAERRVVTLASQSGASVSPRIIRYLNRLGDYLFVAARAAGQQASIPEIPWEKPAAS